MQYVDFFKDEFATSRLGFGMMRLPTAMADGKRVIDRARAIAMLRKGIDGGINYVDTAYFYHDGESEIVTGLALKDGYRQKVRLTTKLPLSHVNEAADMDRLLDEQLKKLDVPYLDFYLLHAVNRRNLEKMRAFRYREFLDRVVRDGRVKRVGFSFHDDSQAFIDTLNDYDKWGMAQIQFNYLDVNNQATENGLREAGRRGIPIVVMEPLRGGSLANPPEEIADTIRRHPAGLSPVQWAFKFIAGYPEVKVILSGMSDEEQLEQNLKTFETLKVGCMSEDDKLFVASLRAAYEKRVLIPCTACAYCQPCPRDVDIPAIFRYANESHRFNDKWHMRSNYPNIVSRGRGADRCVQCGQCESKCPQGIPIMETLAAIHDEYGRK